MHTTQQLCCVPGLAGQTSDWIRRSLKVGILTLSNVECFTSMCVMLLLLMFVRVLTKVPSRYSFGTFTKLVVKCSSQALMYNVCAIVTHNLNGRLAVSLHSGSGSLDLVAAPGGIANVRAREGNRLLHVDLAIDLLKKLQKHLRNSRITTALGSLLVLVVKIVHLLFLQTQTLPLPVSPYFLFPFTCIFSFPSHLSLFFSFRTCIFQFPRFTTVLCSAL